MKTYVLYMINLLKIYSMNPESEDKTPEIEFINNIILEKKINFTSKEWAIIRKNHLKIDLNIDVSLRNFFKKILKDFLLSITCDEEVLETYLKEFNGSIENPLDIRKFKEEFENFTKSFTNKNNRINDKINKINNSLKYIYTYEEAHKEQFFIKDMEKEIFNEAHIFFHDILSTNGNFKSNILLINYNIFLINIKDKIIDLDKDLNEILDYYTYLKHK